MTPNLDEPWGADDFLDEPLDADNFLVEPWAVGPRRSSVRSRVGASSSYLVWSTWARLCSACERPAVRLAVREPEAATVRCVRCPAVHRTRLPEPYASYSAVDAGWFFYNDGWFGEHPRLGDRRMQCPAHVHTGPYWADHHCPDCGRRIGSRLACWAWLTVTDATLGAVAYAVDRAVGPGDPPDDPAGSPLYRLRDSQPWKTLTQPLLDAAARALRWQWTVAWALEDAAHRRTGEARPAVSGQL